MVPDLGMTGDWVLVIVVGLFLVPLFVPIITGSITGRLLPNGTALWGACWTIPLGVANIPTAWVVFSWGVKNWDSFANGWGTWRLWMMASAVLTALLLRVGVRLRRVR